MLVKPLVITKTHRKVMEDTFFDIPVEIKSEFDEKIADVFRIYDHQNNNMINGENLGTILQTLGCVPTEKEIEEIIKETEFEQRKGVIHLSRLIAHLRVLLQKNHMKPYSKDDLFNVFKVLDPKNRGYITRDEFVQFMRDIGEPISEHQLTEMLKVSLDPITMRINYEEYINKIAYEPIDEDSIFSLADLAATKK